MSRLAFGVPWSTALPQNDATGNSYRGVSNHKVQRQAAGGQRITLRISAAG